MRLRLSSWSLGLIALGALAVAVRLAFFVANRDNPFYLLPILDEARYLELARQGRHAGAAAWLYMDPLFPALLSVVLRVVDHILLLRVAYLLLDASTAVLIAWVGGAYFNRRAGWLAGLLYALYAPAVFFSPVLLKPTLLMHVVTWLFVLWRKRRGFGWGLCAGVFILALTLLRANFLLLLPLCLLLAVWLWRRDARPGMAGWIGGVIVGFLVCALAFAAGTYRLTGRASLLPRAGGYVLFIANNEANPLGEHRAPDFVLTNHPEAMDLYFRRQAERLTGRPMDTVAASAYWRRQALDYMIERPGAWLKTASRRAGQWLAAYEAPSNYDFRLAAAAVPWLGWLPGWGTALALGLPGLVLAAAGNRGRLVLGLPAMITLATFTLFFAYGRLRLPAVPGLLLAAGFLADWLWRRLEHGHARRAGTWLWLLPAAALYLASAWWPHQVVPDRVERYNRALVELQLGRTSQVAATAQDLLAEQPGNVQYRFLAANVALAQERYAAAVEGYQSVLAIDPRYPGVWHNLGRAHQGLEQWDLARDSLVEALAQEPSPLTRMVLAQVYQRLGDAGRAAACLDAVIQDPTASGSLRQDARRRRQETPGPATSCSPPGVADLPDTL